MGDLKYIDISPVIFFNTGEMIVSIYRYIACSFLQNINIPVMNIQTLYDSMLIF